MEKIKQLSGPSGILDYHKDVLNYEGHYYNKRNQDYQFKYKKFCTKKK